MEYTVKKLEKSEVEITVTVPQAELEKYMEKASEELAKNAKIKGFRPGKAPKEVIEKEFGKQTIIHKAQDLALQKTYPEVVVKEKLQVVASPKN